MEYSLKTISINNEREYLFVEVVDISDLNHMVPC